MTDGTTTTTATVTIDVASVNDAPVAATSLAASTNDNTSVTIAVAPAGTDVDGDTVTLAGAIAAHGTVQVDGGSIVYTPLPGYTGNDTITFVVSDGNGASSTGTIAVTVAANADDPAFPVSSISVATNEDNAVTATIPLAVDPDGTPILYSVEAGDEPANGTVIIDSTTGQFTYTPDADANGPDSFVVTASDGNGGTTMLTVNVNVAPENDAPAFTGLTSSSTTTDEDTPLVLTLAFTDIESDTVTIVSVASQVGIVSVTGPNQLTYLPGVDLSVGVTSHDIITVIASDGNGGYTTTNIVVDINGVNDAPEIFTNAGLALDEGGAAGITLTNLLVDDSDNSPDEIVFTIDVEPAFGTLNGPGGPLGVGNTFTQQDILDGNVVYIHDGSDPAGIPGDSFEFTVSDGDTSIAGQTFNFAILAQNDAPVITDITPSGQLTTDEDTATNISLQVSDSESASITVVLEASNGRINVNAGSGAASVVPSTQLVESVTVTGSVADVNAALASIGFVPDENYKGPAAVQATVTDGDTTTLVTVPITVVSVNDAPEAISQEPITLDEGGTAILSLTNIFAEDADNQSLQLTIRIDSLPTTGTLAIAGAPVTAVPATFTAVQLASGQVTFTHDGTNPTGLDGFQVTVLDPVGAASNPVTIGIVANAVNDAPVASAAAATTNEDTSVTIPVTITDADSTTLIIISAEAGHGNVAIDNGSGELVYTPDSNFNGSDTVTYTVSDGDKTFTATVDVTITPVDDAPQLVATSRANVQEGGRVIYSADNLEFVDAETPDTGLVYRIDALPSYGTVEKFIPGTGNVTLAAGDTFTQRDINYGRIIYTHDGGDAVTLDGMSLSLSQDGGTNFFPLSGQHLRINVDPINDAPVVGALTGATPIDEGVVGMTAVTVGAFTVTDPDGSGPTFTVSDARFQVVADMTPGNYLLQAKDGASFDFEGEQQISVLVDVNDGGTSVSRTFTVDVANIEEGGPSFFIGAEAATVAENTPLVLGPYVAEDADDSAVTYTLTGADAAMFSISTDGILTFNGADFEGASADSDDVYNVTVNATSNDIGGGTTTATRDVAVTVTNVNEAPTDITLAAASVDENTSGVTVIGALTVSDSDSASFTWTVNDERFAVDGSGNLVLAAGASLDFEATPTVPVTVTATDAGGLSYSKTFTITVTDANEAPVAADVVATVAEDAVDTDVLATVAATDPDAGATLSYSIVGGSTLFEIGNSGNISLIAGQTLDAETATSHTLTVEVSDGTLTDTATVVINVTNVNDNLISAVTDSESVPNFVSENAAGGTLVGIVALATDADLGASITYSLTNNAAGRFAIDAATGVVRVATGAALDYESTTSHTITVQASSSDGNESSATFSIELIDQNEFHVTAPTDTNADTNTISEAATAGTAVGITLDADDADVTTNTVTYTLSDNRFSVSPVGVVQVAAGATFSNATEPFIDLTVTATSADGSSATNAFRIAVTDANVAPVAAVGTATTSEDTTTFGLLSATDADGDALTFTLASGGAPAHGSVVIAPNGLYIYTPTANYNGADSFTYQVSDGHGGTHSAIVSITVNAVNDTPIAVHDTSSGAEDTTQVITVLANDTDADGNPLSVTAAAAGHGTVIVNGDNTLSYTPTANWSGSDSIVYTISDGNGGTATGSVSVTVSAVDDATVAGADSATLVEDVGVTTSSSVISNVVTPQDTISTSGNLLANDSDVESGAATGITGLTGGTQTAPDRFEIDGTLGHLVVFTNGQYVYYANNASTGIQEIGLNDFKTETFTYTNDQGQSSTLTITIHGTNDGPVAVADYASIDENSTAIGDFPGQTDAPGTLGTNSFIIDVLANDTDPDRTDTSTTMTLVPGSVVIAGTPSIISGTAATNTAYQGTAGTVAINGNDIEFTPGTLFDQLDAGDVATVTINYTVQDTGGLTSPGTLTLTVTGTNDGPTVSAATLVTGSATEIADLSASPAENATTHESTGSFEIMDVDLDDTHTVSVFDSQTDSLSYSLLGTFTPTLTQNDPTSDKATIGWTFTVADADLDKLAADETITQTYTVRVQDQGGTGAFVDQAVTITIQGTNDAPIITSADPDTGFTETVATTADATAHTTSGAVSFTDVDFNETGHTASKAVTVTGTTAGFAATALNYLTLDASVSKNAGDGFGSVGWSFSAPDQDFDYLSAGDEIEFKYTVTIEDASGATASQDITITVTGTNDAPDFSGMAATHDLDEASGQTGQATPQLDATGSLAFSDVDLTDTGHTATATVAVTGVGTAGTELPSSTALVALLNLTATKASGSDTGSVAYDFTADDDTFDYLADGEQVTLTYTVTVNDGDADSDNTQTVAITVTGTNDQPMISVATGDSDTASLSESNSALTASDTLTVTDVDITDTVTVARVDLLTATGGNGNGSNTPSQAALNAMFTVTPTPPSTVDNNATTSGQLTWSFNSTPEAFDYLGAGQTQTITYTIRATDDAGTPLSDDQTVTITITGTNDGPTLDLDANDSTVTGPSTAYAGTFTENGLAVAIVDTDADIADLDQTATIQSATITLTNAKVGDVLDTSGVTGLTVATSGAIPGSYTVTLSGTASLADYETALKAITFSNTAADDPNTTDRVINITVTDDQGAVSDTAVSTILVDLDLTQAVHVVDGSSNVVATFDTIQAAIDAIGDGGTATGDAFTASTILVEPASANAYTANEAITIDVPVTIIGPMDRSEVTIGSVTVEPGAIDGAGEAVTLQNVTVAGGSPANGWGISVSEATPTMLGTLTLDNVQVTGFTEGGLYVNGGAAGFDLVLNNADFTGNGTADTSNGGAIKLFEFLGNAALTNVDVDGEGTNAAHGVQLSGYAFPGTAVASAAIGTISFDGVTVAGDYEKTLMIVQGYTDLAGLSFTGTTIGSTTSSAGWTGLYVNPSVGNPASPAATDGTDNIDISGITFAGGSYGWQTALGLPGGNLINGGFGIDGIIGSAGNDAISGLAGNDSIDAGEGDDLVFSGPGGGADEIVGGTGADTVNLRNETAPGVPSATPVTFTITDLNASTIGSTDDDLLVQMGTGVGNAAYGSVTLDGVEDLLITLGTGGDTVVVTNGLGGTSLSTSTITIDGTAATTAAQLVDADQIGTDKAVKVEFTGGDGADTFRAGAGGDIFDGGDGIDTADYSGVTGGTGVTIDLSNTTGPNVSGGSGSDTLSNVENVIGSAFADTITGDGGNNVITGGAGNDTIRGGGGTDQARFSGDVANYTITVVTVAGTPAGAQVGDLVVTGPDGIDVVGTDVESLYFAGSNTTIDLTLGVRVFNASNELVGTFSAIQDGLNAEAALTGTGTVQVIAANYTAGPEALIISSGVKLVTDTNAGNDPNTGPARGAEVTITSVTLASGDVTVDGFTISGATGAAISQSAGVTNVTIQNNIIAPASGQDGVVLTTAGNSTIKVNNNDINVSGDNADGVYLQGSSLQIAGNDISVTSTTNGRGIVANGSLTGITGNTITTAFDGIYVDGNLGGGAISGNTITGTGGTGHVGIAAGPGPTNVTIGSTNGGAPFTGFNAISGFATGIFVDNGNSSVVVREAVTTFTNISGAAIALDPTSETNGVDVVEGVLQLTGTSVSTNNLANVDAAQIGGRGYFVANGSTSALQQGLNHTGTPALMFLSADDHTAGGTVTATTGLSGLTISSPTGATAAIDLTDDTNPQNITLTGTGNVSVTGSNTDNVINASGMTGGSLTANGGLGNDTITGGSGNDTITGGAGDDTQSGGAGNDVFIIADAADHAAGETIDGGANTDVIRFTAATGTLTLDASTTGIEEVRASDTTGATTGTANVNIDASAVTGPLTLTGNDGDNVLTGTSGADTLVGNGGNDTLTGGASTDSYTGGAGNDTYNLGTDTEAVTENAGEGTDTVNVEATYTLAANVENLNLLGSGNFDGTGNAEANVIVGNSGDNVLTGGAGSDTIGGGAGADVAAYAETYAAVTGLGWDGTTATVTIGGVTDTITGVGKLQFADRTVWLVNDDGEVDEVNTLAELFDGVGDEAAAGDIIMLAAGTYAGANIDRSVTIVGPDHGIAGSAQTSGAGAVITSTVTVSAGAGMSVVLAGLEFQNATNNATQQFKGIVVTGAADVTVSNNLFYSTGPNGALDDRAIELQTGAGGDIVIDGNAFTGAQTGDANKYSTANWHRGVWSDGGEATLTITDNVFSNVRTAINLDGYDDSTTNVSGNTFSTAGTGISVGIPVTTTYAGITNNVFQDVDLDFNLQNVTSTVTMDLGATGNTAPVFGVDAVGTMAVLGGTTGDNITGTSGTDALIGNGGADTLNGGGGDDYLDGGAGIDTIHGGAGNDRIIGSLDGGVGLGKDTYDGGADIDTIDYSAATSTVVVNLGNGSGTATGTEIGGGPNADILLAIENVIGGAGADSLTGGSGVNVMVGGAGGDTISGGANDSANDTLTGGAAGDTGDGVGDTFAFAGMFGTDTVTDFEDGVDILQIDVNGTGSVTVIDSGANVQLNVFDDTGGGAVQIGTIILENEDHTAIDSNDWTLV